MVEPQSKHIVFITGAFIHHSCWDEWLIYFENKGFICTAPPWPDKAAPTAADLRNQSANNTDPALLTLSELIDYYAGIIKKLPEKPVLIGHSLGGLITQVLVNRDLAAAGVAIHSLPPRGLIPYEFSLLKAGWKSLGLFTSVKKPYLMSFKTWQYAFTNEMPPEEQKAAYEKLVIPESKTVIRGSLTSAAAIDFAKPHAPLLLTSGSLDRFVPPSINLRNFRKYKESRSILEYREFKGRNHFVLGQPMWREDAGYILEWFATHNRKK